MTWEALQALDPSDPMTLAALAVVGLLVLVALLIVFALRAALRAARIVTPLSQQIDTINRRVDEVSAGQHHLAGGLTQVSEAQARTQATVTATVENRLGEVAARMGECLEGCATRTARALGDLQELLATIDRAQQNIEKLSGDVLGLQDILSNKQARGAFGEIQLAAIVERALPPGSFTMQATLSNGKRADCLIDMPAPPGPIVIDSKFPLEPYEALVAAETDHERQQAMRDLRMAVRRHIRAIAEKYIIEGETADGALMFVPSEAVYAELHARFGEVVREGFEARVWIVSPTTCMATLNTLRAVLKDVRMRQEAGRIRRELHLLHGDIERLGTRVENLDRHFGQAAKDISEIKTSAEKATRRATRLETFDFPEEVASPREAEQRAASPQEAGAGS